MTHYSCKRSGDTEGMVPTFFRKGFDNTFCAINSESVWLTWSLSQLLTSVHRTGKQSEWLCSNKTLFGETQNGLKVGTQVNLLLGSYWLTSE